MDLDRDGAQRLLRHPGPIRGPYTSQQSRGDGSRVVVHVLQAGRRRGACDRGETIEAATDVAARSLKAQLKDADRKIVVLRVRHRELVFAQEQRILGRSEEHT